MLQCTLLLLVLLIFPLAVFPAQTNYLGISRALLLAVLFVGGFPLATALRRIPGPTVPPPDHFRSPGALGRLGDVAECRVARLIS